MNIIELKRRWYRFFYIQKIICNSIYVRRCRLLYVLQKRNCFWRRELQMQLNDVQCHYQAMGHFYNLLSISTHIPKKAAAATTTNIGINCEIERKIAEQFK